MKEFFFNTIQEFNDFIGVKTLHPLVSIARVENTSPIQEAVHHYGLYALFLKENKGCKDTHIIYIPLYLKFGKNYPFFCA